jgi:MgsA AAA+ ATPase C terminal
MERYASQPGAAMYYLARVVEAGEAPKFIARRMVIFASELKVPSGRGQAAPASLVNPKKLEDRVLRGPNKTLFKVSWVHGKTTCTQRALGAAGSAVTL